VRSTLDIEQAALGASVVWLDEPFMFADQKKLYGVVKRILRSADVLISTITATSEMEPISSSVSALLAIADEIHPCRADCDDCETLSAASRSWHLGGPKEEKIKEGGEEVYEPKCSGCWSIRNEEARAAATKT
jgi:thymidine kinase